MPKPTHPMQPIEMHGQILRFKKNKIVRYLLDVATAAKVTDLTQLELIPFSIEDRVQFAQLLGYSVSGFGDLDYVPKKVVAAADKAAEELRCKSS